MELLYAITSHYPQPVVNGSFFADNELNSALSSSFVSRTGVRVLTVEVVLTLESTYMNVI